jgi:acyl-CoA thioester hydrolase
MHSSNTQVRVRYADTDQLGIVYYGNYAQYYEVGRTESLRQLGFTYKYMEDSGISMPVLNMLSEFISPAYYDDLLTITTIIKELPAARMRFEYEIRNEAGKLINRGTTELAFLDRAKGRPVRAPYWLVEALSATDTSS